jgi:hypothetical protein
LQAVRKVTTKISVKVVERKPFLKFLKLLMDC